jgi:hypothetical protein
MEVDMRGVVMMLAGAADLEVASLPYVHGA